MKDWADKSWLSEIKRSPDRVVFWAIVVMCSIAFAHGWI